MQKWKLYMTPLLASGSLNVPVGVDRLSLGQSALQRAREMGPV